MSDRPSLAVRLRVAFDRWAWPHVRRWFTFEVDSEFLRGVAFGQMYHDGTLVSGNSSGGETRYVQVATTWDTTGKDGDG